MAKIIPIIIAPALKQGERIMVPCGVLYLEGYLKKFGYQIKIIDVDIFRYSDENVIELVGEEDPFLIGISGIIAPAYGYIVRISSVLKKHFSSKKIVVGGNVASTAEVLLQHAKVDFVVHGEGELTLKELCEKIENHKDDYATIKGISFIDKNGAYVETPKRAPIEDLSMLDFPNFDLLEMDRYLLTVKQLRPTFLHDQRVKRFLKENPQANNRVLGIEFSRGCPHACTFCYRHFQGCRRFSAQYSVNWIEYLCSKYGFVFFCFNDENFNADETWIFDFVKEIKVRKLKIFFVIFNASVKKVTVAQLEALKEIGCVLIQFGLDSGSNRILSIMDKHSTVEENIKAMALVKTVGIKTRPTLIIGMPGETRQTIDESIDFFRKIGAKKLELGIRYALSLPRTPLYEYDLLSGKLVDEHAYLMQLGTRMETEHRSEHALNHTDLREKEFSELRLFIMKKVRGNGWYLKHQLKECITMIKQALADSSNKQPLPKEKNICEKQPFENKDNTKNHFSFKESYYKLGSLRNINIAIKNDLKAYSQSNNKAHVDSPVMP
ncbi:MAG: B12-binding domain-containing radical SAM protein [Candidatus Omnitrophica bacterium]|nr:B12-binding domain-containing radical SAM protein [Candidatus Omnitrophota bacterium]